MKRGRAGAMPESAGLVRVYERCVASCCVCALCVGCVGPVFCVLACGRSSRAFVVASEFPVSLQHSVPTRPWLEVRRATTTRGHRARATNRHHTSDTLYTTSRKTSVAAGLAQQRLPTSWCSTIALLSPQLLSQGTALASPVVAASSREPSCPAQVGYLRSSA